MGQKVEIKLTRLGWTAVVSEDDIFKTSLTAFSAAEKQMQYRTALIAALRHVEAMGYSAVRLHLSGDCGLYANLGCPDPFWRGVVQLMDEVGAKSIRGDAV